MGVRVIDIPTSMLTDLPWDPPPTPDAWAYEGADRWQPCYGACFAVHVCMLGWAMLGCEKCNCVSELGAPGILEKTHIILLSDFPGPCFPGHGPGPCNGEGNEHRVH